MDRMRLGPSSALAATRPATDVEPSQGRRRCTRGRARDRRRRPALRAVLWPLAADAAVISGGDEFVVVGKRKQFGAAPVRVDIFADRVDAWNRVENVKIGSAWVVERDGQLHAFSTVCPHLGCAVDYDAERKVRVPVPRLRVRARRQGHEAGPSPRPLDALELERGGRPSRSGTSASSRASSEKEPVG